MNVMGLVEKILAIVMIPLSILIIIEQMGFYSLGLPLDKGFLGAGIMIALQLINMASLKIKNKKLTAMNIITGGIFIITALAYILGNYLGYLQISSLPVILGVMMFVEALYALH